MLVRRVRRRRNGVTVQRAAYAAIAVVTAVAAGLALLALAAGVDWLAAGMVASALALPAAAWTLVARARRRWLDARRAIVWVDAAAGLDHRLVTLVARNDRASAFVPLLAAESVERLAPWTVDRLVPDRVPWAHLAAAAAGTYALVLVLLTAPQWRPAEPRIVTEDAIATAPDSRLANVARRLAATTGAPRGAGTPSADASGATSDATGAPTAPKPPLSRLASALQRALRAQLWGAEWARTAASADAPSDGAADREGDVGDHDRASARAARTPTARRDARSGVADERGAGPGGTRAGAGTDPNLFGTRAVDDEAAAGRFPIGLAALVRGPSGEPGPPSGDAPPAELDQHPELAPAPRMPLPFPRTSVPPEWEAAVRAVFARRDGETP